MLIPPTIKSNSKTDLYYNSKDRWLIDLDDSFGEGLGHLTSSFNVGLKFARMHRLNLAVGPPIGQLAELKKRLSRMVKGSSDFRGSLTWEYNDFFDLTSVGLRSQRVMRMAKQRRWKIVTLPKIEKQYPNQIENLDYRKATECVRSYRNESEILFLLPSEYARCDGCYFDTIDLLRALYQQSRAKRQVRPVFRDSQTVKVSVNVRRGDIVGTEIHKGRLLTDAYYCSIINVLVQHLSRKCEINIFSEANRHGKYVNEHGEVVDWFDHPLLPKGTISKVYLDPKKWLEAIDGMIESDILICSKSGFSYLAANLTNAIKIVPPMWHSFDHLDDIILTDGISGTFAYEELEKLIVIHEWV